MSKGFARSGWPRGSESLAPANFVASATPHTKGAWVQVHASTTRDICGMWISTAGIGAAATDTAQLLDIGIGAAASEAVVVSNVPVGGLAVGLRFFLPIHIPSGTRIAGRIQAAFASDTLSPFITLLYAGRPGMWGGYSIAETIGVDTATSGPTTGDLADNAWDEAIASTANTYRALTIHPCSVPGNTNMAAVACTVDVGVGAAGSEVVIGSAWVNTNTAETLTIMSTPEFLEFGVDAGSRLAIRKNSTFDLSGALIGWR